MQREKIIRFLKVLIILDLIFIFSVCSHWSYNNVLEPAYVSTVDACGLRNASEFGYVVSATYCPSDDSIIINVPSGINLNDYKLTDEYQRSLRHEEIHRKQMEAGRLSGCGLNKFGFPGARMIDEIEAYFFSYF